MANIEKHFCEVACKIEQYLKRSKDLVKAAFDIGFNNYFFLRTLVFISLIVMTGSQYQGIYHDSFFLPF